MKKYILIACCLMLSSCRDIKSKIQISQEEYVSSSKEFANLVVASDGSSDYLFIAEIIDSKANTRSDRITNYIYVGEQFLYFYEFKGNLRYYTSTFDFFRHMYSQTIDKSVIKVIDPRTGGTFKNLDLNKYMKDNFENKLYSFDYIQFQDYRDELYIRILVAPRFDEHNDFNFDTDGPYDYYLNLYTEVIYHEDQVINHEDEFGIGRTPKRTIQIDSQLLDKTNVLEVNNIPNLSIMYDQNSSRANFTVNIKSRDLPVVNQSLYNKFPQLKSLKESDKDLHLRLYDLGNEIEVLKYFVEDEKEITFAGVIHEKSKEPVSSYEEFLLLNVKD